MSLLLQAPVELRIQIKGSECCSKALKKRSKCKFQNEYPDISSQDRVQCWGSQLLVIALILRCKNKMKIQVRRSSDHRCKYAQGCDLWIYETSSYAFFFLRMIYGTSSLMTIPTKLWQLQPMTIVIQMILLSRKRYSSRGNPTQKQYFLTKCSFPVDIATHIGTEIPCKGTIFVLIGLSKARISSPDAFLSWRNTHWKFSLIIF